MDAQYFFTKRCIFSDIMNVKDERTLSSGLRALIQEKCDKDVSPRFVAKNETRGDKFGKDVGSRFVAKNDTRGEIGCLRKSCSMTFSNSSQLKQHVQTHNAKGGIYTCEKCGKVFNDPISLQSHKNHLTLSCEEGDSLKLDNSLDQNTPQYNSQYEENTREAERYLSTSDILTELIMFSPNSSPQPTKTSIPNDNVKASPPGARSSSSSEILEELVRMTHIDFLDCGEIGMGGILEPTLFKPAASSQMSLIDASDDMQAETNSAAVEFRGKSVPHSSLSKFRCQVCRLAFDKKAILKEHLLVHSKWGQDRKSWGCQICKLCFTARSDLGKHVKSIHTVTIGQRGTNLPVVGKPKQFRKHSQTEVILLE